MNKITFILMAGLLLLTGMRNLQAQEDRFLAVGSTSRQDSLGRSWAWISLMTSNPEEYLDRNLAVFSKPGNFDAPGEYTLQSIVGFQASPLAIGVLMERASFLGGDTDLLASDIDAVFRDFQLDPSLSLPQKVAAILQGNSGGGEELAYLMLLAAKHPALGLATGLAHAQIIAPTGFTSFEVREWDGESGSAGRVVGRVQVDAENPRVLPAPTGLTEVLEPTARGNLNLRFRWDEPDDLKRLSPLHFGYDIFRMTAGFAEGMGYADSPPDPGVLTTLLTDHSDNVVKVNRQLVLIPGQDDGEMDFFVDDNTTVGDGLIPLVDGDAYYYYVAARDMLGRPGRLSEGLRLQVCDREEPLPPRRIRAIRESVFNDATGEREQRLRIQWEQTQDDDILEYHVYRWSRMDEENFRVDDPENPHVPLAIVEYDPSKRLNSVVDDTLGPEDVNQHYIYTVVALDRSSCGSNRSGHSGMVIDGLVDWSPPPRPDATARIRCPQISARHVQTLTMPEEPGGPVFRVRIQRAGLPEWVEWAEVRWAPLDDPQPEDLSAAERLGRRYFVEAADEVTTVIPAPVGVPITVYVRGGKGVRSRQISDWVSTTLLKQSQGDQEEFVFELLGELVLSEPSEDCILHYPGPIPEDPENPGGDEGSEDDEMEVPTDLPENTASWRVYQRIDDGPAIQIAQGLGGEENIGLVTLLVNIIKPPVCARVRLYVQLTSLDNVEGPRRKIRDFFMGAARLKKPVIAPPGSSGTLENPEVTIRWFTPPYGIEDFTMYVGMTTPPPEQISPDLSNNLLDPGTRRDLTVNGQTRNVFLAAYRTGRVGSGFGDPGSGDFEVTMPINLGQEMLVAVAADSLCGESPLSDVVRVQWFGPQADSPEVPWPVRPLPSLLTPEEYPGLQSAWLPENAQTNPQELNQLGVRVGQFPWKPSYDDEFAKSEGFTIETGPQGIEQIFFAAGLNTDKLLPFIVYRTQLPSPAFPDVSGDVVQVTPLIESVAGQFMNPAFILRDPFFVVLPQLGSANPQFGELYLKDTQPVQRGATYQHYLLQFDERFEPKHVIPLNPVEVPE